ncbi:MAG: WxcM-like domain-containing protein [Rikenellaceae bacterium]
MSKIKVIQGEIFNDYRGRISSLNSFDFQGVERFYFIHHPDKTVVRGWHGHQFEKKWFYCVKGSFSLAFVEPDNWENPSADLVPEIFHIDQEDSKIICLPEGYANCIKANVDGSVLMVYSGKKLPEAYEDSWRYDNTMWVDWAR